MPPILKSPISIISRINKHAGLEYHSAHLLNVYHHLRWRPIFTLIMLLLVAALPRQRKLLVLLSQRFLAHTRVLGRRQLMLFSFEPVNVRVSFYFWNKRCLHFLF